jgi:DNA-binding Xre family transcriptional regulator
MKVSYNRLFKLLIDKQMKKGELCKKAGISTTSIGKLAKGQNLTMDILIRICEALDCKLDDIMELLPNENEGKGNA